MGGPEATDAEPTAAPAAAASGPSRLAVALVALATVTVFAPAAIAGSAAPSSGSQAPASTMPGFAVDVTDAEPEPLIEHVPTEVFDQATAIEDLAQPMMFPPATEPTIRPGRQILIDYGDSAAKCTMNFIYEVQDASEYTPEPDQPEFDAGDLLVGTAGHCVLPGDMPNSEVDAFSQPDVRVCVMLCAGSDLSARAGATAALGDVLYARQELNGEPLGEDYAFLKIPEDTHAKVESTTPVWGGPVGTVDGIRGGEQLAQYGQGIGYGDAEADSRVGIGLPMLFQASPGAFMGAMAASPGDSGGPILTHQDPLAPGPIEAQGVGDLTHLVAGATAGTLSDYAVQFTYEETGVQLALVDGNPEIGG